MKEIIERIKKPTTILSIVAFAFSLGGLRAKLNARIDTLEEFHKQIDIIQLQTTLKEIQVDLTRIKSELTRIQNFKS